MTTTDIIKAYPYVQFSDDENITAWFDAFNTYAQVYLDWFNNTPLAIYTNDSISGEFLDWVANGIYGCYRVPIAYGRSHDIGALNTYTPNEITLNTQKVKAATTTQTMTDDIFRRVITWNFYKGDGLQFTIPWIKRRVSRFLYGIDGFSDTYGVSVSIEAKTVTIAITVSSSMDFYAKALQSVIDDGIVNWPIGYSVNVTITEN